VALVAEQTADALFKRTSPAGQRQGGARGGHRRATPCLRKGVQVPPEPRGRHLAGALMLQFRFG